MKRLTSVALILLVSGMLLVALSRWSLPLGKAEAQGSPPRTVTVLVGGGHDVLVLDNFFPRTLRVRVGDTVTWKFDGDENHHFHTVAFAGGPFPGPKLAVLGGDPGAVTPGRWVPVPGGQPGELMRNPVEAWPTRQAGATVEMYDGTTFVNSGHMRTRPRLPGMPAARDFSLTFTRAGTYRYVCTAHPHMQGTVEVVPADAPNVPDQAEIDRQAKAEADHLLALIDKAKGLGNRLRSEPGPNGTTFWFVRAGAFDVSGDMRGQLFDFLPKSLSVKVGDTVIWDVLDPHTVTFNPVPPTPDPFVIKPQANGRPQIVQNPKVFGASKPADAYEPAQYFNSGVLGMITPFGASWALTFDKPGVYEYVCALHEPMGMKGRITVAPR